MNKVFKCSELIVKRKDSEMSSGERFIYNYLESRNIKFEREFYCNELFNKETGNLLFIDFFLPDYNVAIEIDGIQHFKPVNGRGELLSQKIRDRIKNGFCKKNGVKLIRLRYNELKGNIPKIDNSIKVTNQSFSFTYEPTKKEKKFKRYVLSEKPSLKRLKAKNELRNKKIEEKREAARNRYYR